MLIWILLGLAASGGRAAQAEGLRERIVEHHFRFVPAGDGPFPTIVAIPGCSGIAFEDPAAEAEHPDLKEDDRLFRRHYLEMGERLRGEGVAVLLIHVHGAEGLVKACRGEIGGERIAEYIDEAVAWAKGLDFVDAGRIHVMGWSMGGGGTLAWLHGARRQAAAVRSVVSVYPACSRREPLTNQIPLLMLLGGADDIADPGVCEDLVAASPTKSMVTVRRYAGGRHGFDIADAPPVLAIGNGMTIGHQRAAAEAAWREILAFLVPRSFSGAEEIDWSGRAKQDIAAAYRAAMEDHPGGADSRHPAFGGIADASRVAAMERAERADSYLRYVQAVRSFFGAFEDYHFSVRFDSEHELPPLQWAGLLAVLDGPRLHVVASHGSLSDLVGREVLECDGLTPEELYEQRVKPYQTRPDIEATRRRRSTQIFTRREGQLEAPLDACSFSSAGAEPIRRRLDWSFDGEAYRDLVRRSLYGEKPAPGVREYEPGRWWITASDFNPSNDEEQAAVEAMLADAARHAPRLREAEAVVVDIRGNDGGSSTYGTQIVDAIWGEDYRRSRQRPDDSFVEWRVSPGNVAYMDQLLALVRDRKFPAEVIDLFSGVRSGMKQALAAGRAMYRQAAAADDTAAEATPAPAGGVDNPVKGAVFFLTNINCGSACLDFADRMLSLENVTHIGQVTTADTQYMEVRTEAAPSGLAEFVIPVKVYRDRLRAPLQAYRPEIVYDGFDWSDGAILAWADSVIDAQLEN